MKMKLVYMLISMMVLVALISGCHYIERFATPPVNNVEAQVYASADVIYISNYYEQINKYSELMRMEYYISSIFVRGFDEKSRVEEELWVVLCGGEEKTMLPTLIEYGIIPCKTGDVVVPAKDIPSGVKINFSIGVVGYSPQESELNFSIQASWGQSETGRIVR